MAELRHQLQAATGQNKVAMGNSLKIRLGKLGVSRVVNKSYVVKVYLSTSLPIFQDQKAPFDAAKIGDVSVKKHIAAYVSMY